MNNFLKNIKLKMILWHQKNIWRMPLLSAGIIFIVFGVFSGGMIYQSEKISLFTAHEKIKSESILSNLQLIDNQLQNLSAHASDTKDMATNITTIKNEIESIKSNILTKNDASKITSQISSFQNDMDTQMNSLEKNIAGGINKTYLDEKVLPFKVISIDVISGQPFITVDYEHHQTALQVGDSLVNWKIITVDYQNQTVEFQNDKGQFVKVILQE
jgi:hypothetical protein